MASNQILIRVVSSVNQKTKQVLPDIANNKQLMKSQGWVISDPNYDAKMEALKNNKPFSENGKSVNPVKDSFAAKQEELLDNAFDSKTNLSEKVDFIKEFLTNEKCCDVEVKSNPLVKKRGRQPGSKNKPKQTTNV